MKNIIIILLVIVVVGLGLYFLIPSEPTSVNNNPNSDQTTDPDQFKKDEPIAEPEVYKTKTIIGQSVEGRDITAYHYGEGEQEILFIGGVHGGYAWNTALVAFQAMDYLKANSGTIPSGVKVTIIPVLNPDGLNKVIGTSSQFNLNDVEIPTSQTILTSGRFNANEVDLNRNFDCDWQSSGIWQSKTVSGGENVFSEPEAKAIKNYIETKNPSAVVVWYSSAGGVYSSSCHNGILPKTKELTNIYAEASGYKSYDEFDSYEITGDMVNWLAKKNIPAISVLLTNHTDTDWTKNQAGINAILESYNQ